MAVHHRSVEPHATQACYGRGQPVNDSEVTEHHCRPVIALSPSWRVIMALHHRSVEPQARHAIVGATTLSTTRRSPRSPTVTANWPLRWRSSWRFILIDSNPERCTLSRARPPCQQRRPVGAGERSSRRRQGTPAVSRRMSGDLHPWLHPWRHGWHAASRPRQDVGGWERLLLFSGGAPGTCPTRSTSAGLGMGVSWPVSSKRRLAS